VETTIWNCSPGPPYEMHPQRQARSIGPQSIALPPPRFLLSSFASFFNAASRLGEPTTSYPPSEVEVFKGEEAVGDGRPAGGRTGRRAAARIAVPCLLPSGILIWCVG